jgi:hypothetical protein
LIIDILHELDNLVTQLDGLGVFNNSEQLVEQREALKALIILLMPGEASSERKTIAYGT